MTLQCAGLPTVTTRAWAVSDSRTRVTFTVRGLIGQVHGSVSINWADVEVDEFGNPLSMRAELDLNSLSTGIARRDKDLRKPRFLDIDRQPVMSWHAERFRPADDGRWTAEGRLCVRGVRIPLPVTGTPEPAEDGAVRVRAAAVLDRTAVGISAPRILIGRTVRIDVDAWLTPARLPV